LVFVGIGIIAGIIYFSSGIYENQKEAVKGITKTNSLPGRNLMGPLSFIYVVTFFYFTLNYYYTLLAANKKILSFLKISALIIFVSFIYHSFLFYVLPGALHWEHSSLIRVIIVMMESMIFMFIISYLFAYITISGEALRQKLQLETQISQANFNFLKAQINPHFLHNTLNFLYAKSLPYSDELSEGILILSDIMRYALSKGNQRDGKALLSDEIEHVNNVIKISQLRYNNHLKVNFDVSGDEDGAMIIPFVLITLVENAFMHGDLKNQDYPIDIKLEVKGNKLYFYCRNKKRSGPKQLSTGIGLDNIKKRLELAYSDNYKLTVKDEVEFYTAKLTIDKL
jgi:sensor histidine kinase YesM